MRVLAVKITDNVSAAKSDNNQTDIIEAFNSTSIYSDDLPNIDSP